MTIHEVLHRYWGHSRFRALQEEIILSVLANRDTLALMPTGGGKSICFQVPALVREGICIVVSPLIALMKDQVENLRERGINAVAIVSGMGKREVDILLDNCIYGPVKFLYLSPERLLSELVRERIRHMNVNLIAVDEAHCISQWGYDFRPPYLQLRSLRELHPAVPVLALTATATARVVTDIEEKLEFRAPNLLRKSFERRNLSYSVFREENKFRKLLSVVKNIGGSGIVYVRNRKETQEIARQLSLSGLSSDFYHAGLDSRARSEKQDAWKKGRVPVIVATNAFGMGIDKPDVRFVVHLDLPESPEAYFQEAGRAGRDEQKAYAVLLYDSADKARLLRKLELSFPSVEEIRTVYHQLGNYFQLAYGAGEGLSLPFDLAEFCSRFTLDALKTINALKFLERDSYLTVSESAFLPSRIKMLVSPEDLYSFQVEQAEYDGLIKLLLRSYGGLFEQYAPIREYDLSQRSSYSLRELTERLQKLHALGLIDYLPQTDTPMIQFIRPRTDSKNLLIDRSYIQLRKEVMSTQVHALIRYAETWQCRSQLLLAYFDEQQAQKCGVCDVCLEEKRKVKQSSLLETIENELLQLLSAGHLDLDKLVSSVRTGNEKERISVIRTLLDAGKIKSDGDNYYI